MDDSIFLSTDPNDFLKNIQQIDDGSTCSIYSAFYPQLNKQIAFKKILLTENIKEHDIIREIKIMKQLSHPNIVHLISSHRIESTIYILMDLL